MPRSEEYDDDERYVVIERREGGVTAFLLGLAVGAGVALLLAPESGEETRRRLGRKAREVGQRARTVAEDLTERALDQYEQTKQTVEEKLGAARDALEIKKRQASEAIRAGREAAKQAREDLEARIAETKSAYQQAGDIPRGPRRPAIAGADVVDDDKNSDATQR